MEYVREVFQHCGVAAKALARVLQRAEVRVKTVWQALGMQAKLSVLIAGLILVMASFFCGFAVYQTTREIRLSAIGRGQAMAQALKDEVVYSLQIRNYPGLNVTFRRLAAARSDIAYVALLGPAGNVLAHSDAGAVGQRWTDPLTLRSLSSNIPRIQFERRNLGETGRKSELCDLSVPILTRGRREGTLRIGLSLTHYLRANGPRIRSKIALFMIPFAFLSVLIAMKLAQSFTRPLQHLARAASEVSRGNYDVQLPLDRQDELGEVAQAFNHMAQNLKEHFTKVSDMANRDGLTGFYNARFFQEALTRELGRTRRTGRPLSLIIFDADHFKQINDRYGHPVGDQALQHLARVTQAALRGYDVLARYGGEEFIVLLTETTGVQAASMGERLRRAIEQQPLKLESGLTIKVTVSVGVAQARAPYDKKDLISRADQALYRAKETGRNKVALFRASEALEDAALNTRAPRLRVVS